MNHSPSQKLSAGLQQCAADYKAMNDKDEGPVAKLARERCERLATARATLRSAQRHVGCNDCRAIHEILSTLLDEIEARS